jgi:hypothetical protein
MTPLLALAFSLYGPLTPVKVHVDGTGYMRFIRDGRVVYAKVATFVNIDGELGSEGAKLLPGITIPPGTETIKIDLQGNVDAGANHLGRLVIAVFPPGSTSSTTDDFFTFSERPTLTNPGEDTAGVIRIEGDITKAPVQGTTNSAILTKGTSSSASTTKAAHGKTTSTTAPGPQVEIIVRQHSEVPGDAFTLGDIATINGPDDAVEAYKAVKIGATAIAGFNRIIDQRYLIQKLRGAGHPEGTYVLVVPEKADVGRKVRTVTVDEITNTAIQAAQDKIGAKLDFRITGTVKPIIAPDGEVIREASDPEPTAKGYTVVVTAREGNTIVGTQTVTLVPPAQTGGVKVGDPVKVVLKSGTAVIEVEGKALTAGFVGQKIKVSVTASPNGGEGKTTTHTGTVIDAGRVEVDL